MSFKIKFQDFLYKNLVHPLVYLCVGTLFFFIAIEMLPLKIFISYFFFLLLYRNTVDFFHIVQLGKHPTKLSYYC